jgi:hypothetical protein
MDCVHQLIITFGNFSITSLNIHKRYIFLKFISKLFHFQFLYTVFINYILSLQVKHV